MRFSELKNLFSSANADGSVDSLPDRPVPALSDEIEQTRRDLLLAHLELMKQTTASPPDETENITHSAPNVVQSPQTNSDVTAPDIKASNSSQTSNLKPQTFSSPSASEPPALIDAMSQSILREIVAADMARRQTSY
jgi:hypothetical protein